MSLEGMVGLVNKLRGKEPLTGKDFLEKAYHELIKKNESQSVIFDVIPRQYENDWEEDLYGELKFLWFEIADDSDHHRERRGWMRYDSIDILTMEEQQWVVGYGVKSGSYPGDRFSRDILAIPTQPFKSKDSIELAREVLKKMRKTHSEYFTNSLIVAMSDGSLQCPRDSQRAAQLYEKVGEQLQPEEPITEDTRYMLASTLQPVTISTGKYNPELIPVVVEGIKEVLKSNKS
jgi:hypothetical protein